MDSSMIPKHDELPRFARALRQDQPCTLCEQTLTRDIPPSEDGPHNPWPHLKADDLQVSAEGGCQTCRLRYLGLLQIYGPFQPSDKLVFEVANNYGINFIDVTGHWSDPWENRRGVVSLYTQAGQAQCPWLPVTVGRDVRSRRQSYAAIVRGWLSTCHSTHPACASKEVDTALPSRVIDVAQIGSDTVRLKETHAQHGRYLALSHCWGGEVPIQTTSKNRTDMMRGIAFSDLPRTFQDAVSVTRDLGQRYLWIDALCIIQDDTRDWEQESGNMAAIYQNAYMVIGADMSVNSHGGFLDSERAYSKDGTPIAIVDDDDASKMATIYARKHESHLSQCLMLPQTDVVYKTPLSQRAWTLQEQFLATRMAHFDQKEIIWQCDSAVFCECMELDNSTVERSGRKRYLRSLVSSSVDKYKTWYSIVDTIIQRSITKPQDILPALSGLARRVQDNGGGRYLAGLWLDNLPRGLLWWVSYNYFASRAVPYRAPSWSWASVQVEGNVFDHHDGELDPDARLDPAWAKVTKAVATPKGADPLGAVANGYLEVHAPVLETTIQLGLGLDRLIPSRGSPQVSCRIFSTFDFPLNVNEGDTLHCLFIGQLICKKDVCPVHGLLLRRLTGSSEGYFERVGIFMCDKGSFSELEQLVHWSTVTII